MTKHQNNDIENNNDKEVQAKECISTSTNWSTCPYISDIAIIKLKLDTITIKLDSISIELKLKDQSIRALELLLAKQNGIFSQKQLDIKTIMFILMFITTCIGTILSFIK